MSVDVGKDIESVCRKCGDVWHVVVAKVDTKVAKVQCKECGGYHQYRAPGEVKKAAAKKKRATTTRAKKAPVVQGPTVEPDMSREIRPYTIKESFVIADRIQHPNFGVGTVEESNSGKVTVFFSVGGRKMLGQAKKEMTLSRPKPFVHKEKVIKE